MAKSADTVIAAIPARWGSTRFPGKPLAALAGEPVIAHVVRRALAARTVDQVLVATDDERIAAAAAASGAEAVLTGDHASGTDRIAAAVAARRDWSIVVNLQGDEPLLEAGNIDHLVDGMRARPEALVATLCRPLPAGRSNDANAVKVVRRTDGRALFFSRSALPFPRNPEAAARLWRLHLGIYGFRRAGLERFIALPPSPLELAEGLEQLRALEDGLDILVLDAPYDAWGVDTPEDLARAEELLHGRSPAAPAATRKD